MYHYWISLISSALGLALAPCALAWGQQIYKDYPAFEKAVYQSSEGELPYRLLKPVAYSSDQHYPLIVFFHGFEERGIDNVLSLTHIAPLFTKGIQLKNYPCFVLVPQCPPDSHWVDEAWQADAHTLADVPTQPLALAMGLIDEITQNYPVDSQRIYLSGISMGGFATWELLARQPEKFAAAVPICGGGDEKMAFRFKDVPVWAFHGRQDQVVKPERSRNMIMAIKEAGGQPKYTEYPEAYHDSWVWAYEDPELLKWLFAQQKK